MKRAIFGLTVFVLALLGAHSVHPQTTASFSGYCNLETAHSSTTGDNSANESQDTSSQCIVTVYEAGTANLATIYSDQTNHPMTNEFKAGATGQWRFFAAINQSYDIVLNGGIGSNGHTSTVSLKGIHVALKSALASGSPEVLHPMNSKMLPKAVAAAAQPMFSEESVTVPIESTFRPNYGRIGIVSRVGAPANLGEYGPIINPMNPAFGAKCDGVTDDSAALQAAINSAESATTGIGEVLIPPTAGNSGCVFGTTLLITSNVAVIGTVPKDYWNLSGSGLAYTGTGDAILITNTPNALNNIKIENLFITTTAAANSLVHLERVDGPVDLRGNILNGAGLAESGIVCFVCGIQFNIHDNYINSVTGALLTLQGGGNVSVKDNQFFNSKIGILAQDTTATIADNYFELMTDAVEIQHAYSNLLGQYDIHGNSFNNQSSPPISSPVNTGSQRCVLINGSYTQPGAFMTGSIEGNNCSLAPNSMQGMEPYGVEFEINSPMVANWSVENNTFIGMKTSAIYANSPQTNLIYNNNTVKTSPSGSALPQVSGHGNFQSYVTASRACPDRCRN